jgi:hypothetical protein
MIQRNTWIALGAFALVLLAAIVWTRQSGGDEEADITPTPEALWDLEARELQALSILETNSGMEVTARRHPEDGWVLDAPSGEVANSGTIERTATSLLILRPRSTIAADDREPFDLDPAMYRLTLELADGSSHVLLIGREAPTGGVRYVALPLASEVTLVNSFSLQDIIGWIEAPPVVTPTVEGELTSPPE